MGCRKPVAVGRRGPGYHSPSVQWPGRTAWSWRNSPGWGNGQWDRAQVRLWEGQLRPTAEMPLPSAVSQVGPRSTQTVPFRGWSPGGAVWQMPPTDVAPEAHPASVNMTSVSGGQQHPWYLTDQGPWDHCGRSSQKMLRDLCKQLALILGGVSAVAMGQSHPDAFLQTATGALLDGL